VEVVRFQNDEALVWTSCMFDEIGKDVWGVGFITYQPPTVKIPISACFCLFVRFRLRMTRIGSRIMAKSVMMLMLALVNPVDGSQLYIHAKKPF
jgi:hypothetical protein